MKKITIYIITIACTILFNINASSAQAFKYGDNILGIGIGVGSSLSTFNGGSSFPALSVQYEHGNWAVGGPGVISLGGYFGYTSFSWDYYNYYSEKLSYAVIGIRSAYHYNGINSKDWDVYGGAMLSYDIASYTYTPHDNRYLVGYSGSYGSGLFLSLFIGGRYFVSENVALFAELGYGISTLNLGAAFRL